MITRHGLHKKLATPLMLSIAWKISWINATQEHDQFNNNKALNSYCYTPSVLGRVTCLETLCIAVNNVCDQCVCKLRDQSL